MYVLKKKCGLFGSTPIYFQLMLTGDLKKLIIVLSVLHRSQKQYKTMIFLFVTF